MCRQALTVLSSSRCRSEGGERSVNCLHRCYVCVYEFCEMLDFAGVVVEAIEKKK